MLQNLNILKFKTQRSHLLTTWTWCGKKNVQHGGAHIIKVQCAYIPHAQISEFLNDEQSHENSLMEWNIYKWVLSQENVKMPRIQNHLGFMARHHLLHLRKKKQKDDNEPWRLAIICYT